MSKSKIKFSTEKIVFSCKGNKAFVQEMFNELLKRLSLETTHEKNPVIQSHQLTQASPDEKTIAKELIVHPAKNRKEEPSPAEATKSENGIDTKSALYQFLEEKDALRIGIRRFLGTAVFLHSQGVEHFYNAMITEALNKIGIERFSNITNMLDANVTRKYCIRGENKDFFLTEEGIRSILATNTSSEE